MVLLTSLCAIRVANVPEVCVGKNKGKKREREKKSRLRAHKRWVGDTQERMSVTRGAGARWVGVGQTCRLAGGLTGDGWGTVVFIQGVCVTGLRSWGSLLFPLSSWADLPPPVASAGNCSAPYP